VKVKKYDVIIYMRYIKLDVVIPKPYVWEFMEQFGNEFAVNCLEGGKDIKSVDGYYDHPGGWHIQISVFENDEERFYDFLQKFCEEKGISYRDPRQEQ
jgi:hypothetical protein